MPNYWTNLEIYGVSSKDSKILKRITKQFEPVLAGEYFTVSKIDEPCFRAVMIYVREKEHLYGTYTEWIGTKYEFKKVRGSVERKVVK